MHFDEEMNKKERKEKKPNSSMTFRFGQIQFMLESRKSYPTSTYGFLKRVQIYIASTSRLCIIYIVLHTFKHTHTHIAQRLLPFEYELHANSTFAKQINVLIMYHSKATKRKLQQKISSPTIHDNLIP